MKQATQETEELFQEWLMGIGVSLVTGPDVSPAQTKVLTDVARSAFHAGSLVAQCQDSNDPTK